MSWKSILSAGLLCVIASPALAAPTLTVTGSRLTRPANPANAIRVWNIAVAPDLALSPGGSPLALELGFRATGGNILSISTTQNMAPEVGRVEHNDNPGEVIFGWEALTDVGAGNMKPVGLQVGTGANINSAVAYIGTTDFTTGNRQDLITITTQASVTSLAWGGRYNADGTMAAVGAFVNGRVAQGQGASTANFDTFSGTLAQNAAGATRFIADMNGDGNTNFGDLAAFGQGISNPVAYRTAFPHLNRIGRGDGNGDGNFNFGDLAAFGQILTGAPGAGASLEVASVPEPATGILAGLGLVLFAVARRRSR